MKRVIILSVLFALIFSTFLTAKPEKDQSDSDEDGIPNFKDNCINVKNADQADFDRDSVGDLCDVDIDNDGYKNEVDCDDYDRNIHPNSEEKCDGKDNDCNNIIDDRDLDGDGFISNACAGGTDCKDDDSAIYPGATEQCDGKDNNCNEAIDENCNDEQ